MGSVSHSHQKLSRSLLRGKTLLEAYDTFIIDADGVLWTGKNVIEGAPRVLGRLISAGKDVFVLSNNSSQGIAEYVAKFQKLGFQGIKEENIVTSALVCASELKRMIRDHKYKDRAHLPVYLVGSKALQKTLAEQGIECFGVGPDPPENYLGAEEDGFSFNNVDVSQKPFAVVSSFDPYLSYIKIMKAATYLKDPSLPFIATNEDLTYPGTNPKIVYPGAGTTSTILRAISGREPIIMGKPHPSVWEFIRQKLSTTSIDSSRVLMVGDRCDTDILFGNRNNLDTLLVLTGISSLDDVERSKKAGKDSLIPKFFTDRISDLENLLD